MCCDSMSSQQSLLVMRKPVIKVVASQPVLLERVQGILRGIDAVEVKDSEIAPDVICLGADGCLDAADLDTAKAMGGGSRIPMALITWNGSETLAMQAMHHGMKEYLRGNGSREEIASVLLSMCAMHAAELQLAAGELLVGQSAAIRTARAYIEKVAKTSTTVLITGETGTGKEVIAELIHHNSPRAHKPLICVNCAAIPDSLLESELFGYERGAFTGAHTAHDGKFQLADGGTVLLDEIGDMTPYAQAKILRIIENREVQRLGSKKSQRVDVRILAATNRDLEHARESFRWDLFFRLNVARIHLPPLRERKDDLLMLANHFRVGFNRSFGRGTLGFTRRAEQAILGHDWPGNVRELKNMIEAAFINVDQHCEWIEMPELFCRALEQRDEVGAAEVDRILAALSQTHFNKTKAAQLLQCSRMTLYRKMERYGIAGADNGSVSANSPILRQSF